MVLSATTGATTAALIRSLRLLKFVFKVAKVVPVTPPKVTLLGKLVTVNLVEVPCNSKSPALIGVGIR